MPEESCDPVGRPVLEQEGVAETTCDELTVTPIPRTPVLHGLGEEIEKWN